MKLSAYMKREGLSFEAMAERIGDCSQGGLRKWASGDRIPNRETMERIFVVTEGAVAPNDFYALDDLSNVQASDPTGLPPVEVGA